MRRFLEYIIVCVMVIISSSCNIDEEITTSLPPKISIEGNGSYRVRLGDELHLAPRYENSDEATYSWSIEGVELSNEPTYTFTAQSKGLTKILLTVSNTSGSDSRTFSITTIDRFMVYDYTPAPGQFIGELKTGGFVGTETTYEDAIAYAESRLMDEKFVSLGAFGGYIIVGFDRIVENRDGYDFSIGNNAFDGSSEPGVVWVMQDENGDGEPNDTWYELSGSETGKAETIQNYTITYYRPEASKMDVAWSDNMGGSGVVKYLEDFHNQDFYYPAWIDADSYTLRGTLLKSRSYDSSGNGSKWVNPAFDWGYADNASTVDNLNRENHFEISNAIDEQGNAVKLEYIDFIKVQSAIQQQCGWIGEVSTEVTSFKIIDSE
ncbi:MAG: hypothetical protein J6U82_05915 [Alistipes sp.]|nr:hypothetical protein [Alistipes sp.]